MDWQEAVGVRGRLKTQGPPGTVVIRLALVVAYRAHGPKSEVNEIE